MSGEAVRGHSPFDYSIRFRRFQSPMSGETVRGKRIQKLRPLAPVVSVPYERGGRARDPFGPRWTIPWRSFQSPMSGEAVRGAATEAAQKLIPIMFQSPMSGEAVRGMPGCVSDLEFQVSVPYERGGRARADPVGALAQEGCVSVPYERGGRARAGHLVHGEAQGGGFSPL